MTTVPELSFTSPSQMHQQQWRVSRLLVWTTSASIRLGVRESVSHRPYLYVNVLFFSRSGNISTFRHTLNTCVLFNTRSVCHNDHIENKPKNCLWIPAFLTMKCTYHELSHPWRPRVVSHGMYPMECIQSIHPALTLSGVKGNLAGSLTPLWPC